MATEPYNSRYVAYANERGNEPTEQLAQDAIDWPGGKMAGFILWVRQSIVEFSKAHPKAGFFTNGHLNEGGHVAYDAWLAARVLVTAA